MSLPPDPLSSRMLYTHQRDSFASQRGNVLVFILIAVGLFAALSFAVTQSSKGTQNAPTSQQNLITASQMTQMADDLQEAILAMVASGTKLSDIQVHDASGPGTPQTSVVPCTAAVSNCLFAMTNGGGGAAFPVLPAGVTTSVNQVSKGGTVYPTSINIYQISDGEIVNNVDGNQALIVMVVSPIQQALCQAINTQLGISPLPTGPTAVTSNGAAYTITGFTSTQLSGCWYSTDNGPNFFYSYFHVLGAP